MFGLNVMNKSNHWSVYIMGCHKMVWLAQQTMIMNQATDSGLQTLRKKMVLALL